MKCLRPNCPNKGRKGKNQGYCAKHYNLLPTKGLADAGPVRERLKQLRQMGYGHQHLADLLGMTRPGLEWILQGKSANVHARTAALVMAVPVPLSIVAMGGLVSTLGTRRRLQALAVQGWSQREIAEQVGLDPKTLSRAMSQSTMLAANAAAVTAVFNRLQMVPGSNNWVRQRALNKGWAPPLAWDENAIDDPAAQPVQNVHQQVGFLEKYEELVTLNIPSSRMPEMLGIQQESFERQLSRHSLGRTA